MCLQPLLTVLAEWFSRQQQRVITEVQEKTMAA